MQSSPMMCGSCAASPVRLVKSQAPAAAPAAAPMMKTEVKTYPRYNNATDADILVWGNPSTHIFVSSDEFSVLKAIKSGRSLSDYETELIAPLAEFLSRQFNNQTYVRHNDMAALYGHMIVDSNRV